MKRIILTLLIICINNLVFSQWIMQNSNTSSSLTDIHFIDNNIGVSAGTSGTVLKTDNGGQTWQLLQSNTSVSFNSVYGLDINNIYIGKLSLRKTTNGNSFFEIGGLDLLGGVKEIYFFDSSNGIILNSNGILKTNNQATSWQHTNIYPSQNAPLGQLWINDFQFTDLNTGYAYGGFSSQNYGEIFKTTDAGNNWVDINLSTTYISAMNFIDSTIGYYFTYNSGLSSIYKTIDGGNNWNLINDNINQYITEMVFIDELIGYTVSLDGNIDKTIDGGITWTNSYSTNGISLSSIEKTPNNSLYAIGNNGLILKNEELVLSTNDETLSEHANIYPNPATDILYIDFNHNLNSIATIQLYNIYGQLIINKTTQSEIIGLKINQLQKGTYFLQVTFDKKVYNEKIILK